MQKQILTGAAIIVVTLLVVFGMKGGEDSEAIKIGGAFALTGDAAPWGEVSKKAAELAVEEINAAGGINGRTLELVIEDSKSTSKDSVLAVAKLVNVDKVDAVMITWLDSYPGAESVVPQNMILISQDAAIESVNVPTNHSNTFSLWYRTASKAKAVVEQMVRDGVKTLSIVTQNDPYYVTLREFIKKEAVKEGISIVGEDALTPGDDARTVVAKIQEKKPHAVFFGSYDEGLSVTFLKQYRDGAKVKIPLYGDEFIEQDFSSKNFNKAWLEGIAYYVPSEPDPVFKTNYEKKFGETPKFSAGTTYDTVFVIARMFKDSPRNSSEYMRKNTFNTKTYGPITFDEVGGVVSTQTALSMKKIQGGRIVPLK